MSDLSAAPAGDRCEGPECCIKETIADPLPEENLESGESLDREDLVPTSLG